MPTNALDQAPREMVALNADIVGYSKLLADDFEATTAAMQEYHHLVERRIAESGGTLVNFVGDNFMAVFDERNRRHADGDRDLGRHRSKNSRHPE